MYMNKSTATHKAIAHHWFQKEYKEGNSISPIFHAKGSGSKSPSLLFLYLFAFHVTRYSFILDGVSGIYRKC